MTDLETIIRADLDRRYPLPALEPDWGDILNRAQHAKEIQVAPRPRALLTRISRSPRRPLTAAILLLTLIGTVIALSVPRAGGLTLLQRAEAALTIKPGTILYTRFLSTQTDESTHVVTRQITEVWRDRSGGFRAIIRIPGRRTSEEIGGIWYSTGFIRSPGPTLIYNRKRNTIAAAGFRFAFGDPAAGLRSELSRKQVHIVGKTTINGRSAIRLAGPEPAGISGEVIIDANTGYPLEARFALRHGDRLTKRITRFEVYRYLSATNANVRLTNLRAQHPSAQVNPGTCNPLGRVTISGVKVCP